MSITTFVTSAEMPYYLSNWTDYDSGVKNQALSDSYGLVLSFLNPTIQLPLINPWDGTTSTVEGAPPILKVCQARFCQHLVQFQNIGWTDEARNLFDDTANLLRSLQAGELGIPNVTTTQVQTGWSLTSSTSTTGTIHIQNPGAFYESYPITYEFTIDSASSGLYPYHGTFNTSNYATFKYRLPNISSTYIESNKPADNTYTTYGTNGLAISFEGTFNPNDTFVIRGIPQDSINVMEPNRFIHQRNLRRGA